ncbi:LysR family transcriptional regulator [Aquabacterium sp. OR-4]|uniref:LysR family transcriptional regulator n=1 Tax=Aquabacterium sp. OR-4 TaxID=2978127 RepID=UPI0021B3D691|nr:LysR family transcriptional regulator [Aquabacterium sp. OR-4]MDT7838200.1 LysR family transcriptional regulator [Aquabacterium sp. OR-4]
MNTTHDTSALQRLDLNLFRVFEAVWTERNLTRAAELLCVSQPAVSHALARLRRQLDDPLFVREGNGVRPTALATQLWPEVQQALQLLRQALRRSQHFEPVRDVGELTLAINDEGEPLVLPPLLAQVARSAPQAVVHSVRLGRKTLRSDLASGRIDCAIDIAQPTAHDVLHRPLTRETYVLLSHLPQPPSEAQYRSARHVQVSTLRTGRAVEDLALAQVGLQRQIGARCQRYDSAARLVMQAGLLLTLPHRLALPLATELGAHLHPLPIALPAVEMHLYWHQQRDADPLNAWLRECIVAAAR